MLLPKITIGILTRNSKKYIVPCLRSLFGQTYREKEIIVLDNASTDGTPEHIKDKFRKTKVINSKTNLGFSRGHNAILNLSKTPFYLCANIDIVFDKHCVAELVKTIAVRPNCASVSPVMLKWDFKNNEKKNIIDSLGLNITRAQKFFDINQGKKFKKIPERSKEIFGCSAAAALYRVKDLEKIAVRHKDLYKEYFDELMFMYKEDCDLVYRLRWLGLKSFLCADAFAWHDRTACREKSFFKTRKSMPNNIKMASFVNQIILEKKNFSPKFSKKTKIVFYINKIKRFFYILFFEPYLLAGYLKIFFMRQKITAKRQSVNKKISVEKLEKWFV